MLAVRNLAAYLVISGLFAVFVAPTSFERLRANLFGNMAEALSRYDSRRDSWYRLLREAMALRGRMDLAGYDRLFPSQDVLPTGGVGNLIAAPLHGRSRKDGATVFLDLSTLAAEAPARKGFPPSRMRLGCVVGNGGSRPLMSPRHALQNRPKSQ